MLSHDLDTAFYALLVLNILAGILTGSTWQWVIQNGGFLHTQYNIIVTIAAGSSLIQTITCYINALMHPSHNLGFMIYILVNWVIMTHSSVMLVSRKLSLTYQRNTTQVWHRLLLINVFMFPLSVFICLYWAWAYNVDENTRPATHIFQRINKIMEPVQITLWGIIEFCLSGAFIVQMWKFSWTQVERKAIFVLVLVACCDVMSVLSNVIVGDLESTTIKGFVYCLRIRLEVSVLNEMVEFVKNKRGSVTFGTTTSRSSSHGHKRRRSYFLNIPTYFGNRSGKSWRGSSDELIRNHFWCTSSSTLTSPTRNGCTNHTNCDCHCHDHHHQGNEHQPVLLLGDLTTVAAVAPKNQKTTRTAPDTQTTHNDASHEEESHSQSTEPEPVHQDNDNNIADVDIIMVNDSGGGSSHDHNHHDHSTNREHGDDHRCHDEEQGGGGQLQLSELKEEGIHCHDNLDDDSVEQGLQCIGVLLPQVRQEDENNDLEHTVPPLCQDNCHLNDDSITSITA